MKEPDINDSGNTRRLKDFLDKKQGGPDDDFDLEAREGFDAIAPEEAIRLHSRLDQRMHTEVLPQKKENKLLFRVAIAAMLVITLMSAYFILQNDSLPPKNNLAIQTSREPVIRQTEIVSEPHIPEPPVSSANSNPQAAKKNRTAETNLPVEVAASPAAENKKANDEPVESDLSSSAGKAGAGEPSPEAVPAVAMNNGVDDQAAMRNQKAKAANKQATAPAAMGAARAADMISRPQAIYAAGTAALAARLKIMLAKNQLGGKFDATLYIDSSNRVIDCKVTWTDLMKGREKELEELLKQLDGFSVSPPGSSHEKLEYKIVYRPD